MSSERAAHVEAIGEAHNKKVIDEAHVYPSSIGEQEFHEDIRKHREKMKRSIFELDQIIEVETESEIQTFNKLT